MVRTKLKNIFAQGIRDLSPGYFAMVMSTGIISIAFLKLGFDLIFMVLFLINLVTYAVLISMLIARIVMFTGNFLDDLKNPIRGFGF